MTTTALVFRPAATVLPGTVVLDPTTTRTFTLADAVANPDGALTLTGPDTADGMTDTVHAHPDTLVPVVLASPDHPIEGTVPATYGAGDTATIEIVPAHDLTYRDAVLTSRSTVDIIEDTHTDADDDKLWVSFSEPITTVPRDARWRPDRFAFPYALTTPFARVITA